MYIDYRSACYFSPKDRFIFTSASLYRITFISMIVIFVNRTIFAFYFIYGEGTGFGRRGGSCLSTSLPQDCL